MNPTQDQIVADLGSPLNTSESDLHLNGMTLNAAVEPPAAVPVPGAPVVVTATTKEDGTTEDIVQPTASSDGAPVVHHSSEKRPSNNNNSNNNNNSGGSSNRGGPRRLPPTADNEIGRRQITVAAASRVKQVAGSIAHTARAEQPPLVSSVGATCVNQAVKAIAIARSYLEDNELDLFVVPTRPRNQNNDIRNLIWFDLSKEPRGLSNPVGQEFTYVDLKSASSTSPGQLGGAIAKSIRDGHRVRINSIGADSVFRAVDSVVCARSFLQEDNLDIRMQPEFISVTFSDGGKGNGMQLVLYATQLAEVEVDEA